MSFLVEQTDYIAEFDADLWNAMIENVTVSLDKTLSFRFYDGAVITIDLSAETPKSTK